MVVRAAGNDPEAFVFQRLSENGSVFHQLLLICLELIAHGFLEADRLGSDHVHQRAALQTGEYFGVDRFDIFFFAEDQTGTGTAQGFVRGGRDNIAVRDRGGMHTGSHETGNVSHVNKEISVRFVCDLTQAGEVDDPRIGRCTGEDHAGLTFHGEPFDFIVVDCFRFCRDAVGNNVEELAGEVHGVTVGQVSAVVQTHGKDGIAGVQQGEVNSHVRLGTGVGLHVGSFRTEEFAGTLNGDFFHFINKFATAVVAASGITFCVLVGENAALCCADSGAGEVFGSDQFNAIVLTVCFGIDPFCDFRIGIPDGGDVIVGGAFQFFESAHMAGIAGEGRFKPCLDEGFCFFHGDVIRRQNQHIAAVVFTAGTDNFFVVRHSSADRMETVGINAHADAGTADQDPDLQFTLGDGKAHLAAEIRVVIFRIQFKGTEVLCAAAQFRQISDQLLLQFKSAVVRSDPCHKALFAVPVHDLSHDFLFLCCYFRFLI